MTVPLPPNNARAVAALVLAMGMALGSVVPVETPCAAVCPCDAPQTADGYADGGPDIHYAAGAAEHHESSEHESGEPCDDDCPLCGGAAVALVTPALGMPVRCGTWRTVSSSFVLDTVHRSASSGVFRPPRQLG